MNRSSLALLCGLALTTGWSVAATTSINTGSLGSAADGTHTLDVVQGVPGAVTTGGDQAVSYTASARTTIPYQADLNPSSTSPFTIEFWVNPSAATDDSAGPSPLFNRTLTSPRSGWVFFQRSPSTGWNFRMFDGNGSNVGWDLTGGSYTVGQWTHIVTIWNGSAASMYVNGVLADDTNVAGRSGIYNASTSAIMSIGSYVDGNNPFSGSVDELAFYDFALDPSQIQDHFDAISSAVPGEYASLVLGDEPLLYLQNLPVPEPGSAALALLGGLAFFRRRK